MQTTPASVLVIESHPMMRLALCSAIAVEPDFMVLESNVTAKESLTLAIMDDVLFLPAKPEIILLAVGNPGQDELRALKALCKTLPCTPILALITNEVPGQEQAALEAGAQVVLTKAASRGELINALRELRMKTILDHSESVLKKELFQNVSK
jgi:two-component system, NarL family, nitrate/nitrite response regulator NarL